MQPNTGGLDDLDAAVSTQEIENLIELRAKSWKMRVQLRPQNLGRPCLQFQVFRVDS
jgi:hypothetical protein